MLSKDISTVPPLKFKRSAFCELNTNNSHSLIRLNPESDNESDQHDNLQNVY